MITNLIIDWILKCVKFSFLNLFLILNVIIYIKLFFIVNNLFTFIRMVRDDKKN